MNYLYVDNSNVWIEGMYVAAVQRGLAPDVWAAHDAKVSDHSWKVDFGRLQEFAGGQQSEIGRAVLYGSRPPANDSLWSIAGQGTKCPFGPMKILVYGAGPIGRWLALRLYQGGHARLLKLDARGLQEERRSPTLGRAMVAVTPWQVTAEERVWAAAVWTRMGSGFTRAESRVFLLDPTTGDLLDGGS